MPVVLLITIIAVSNLNIEWLPITAALTVLLFFLVTRGKFNKVDLWYLLLCFWGALSLTGRPSLALLFPVIARQIIVKKIAIQGMDLAASLLLLIAVIGAKALFLADLEVFMQIDRNYLSLFVFMLVLIKPQKESLLVDTLKMFAIFTALFLYSRTFYLVTSLFLLSGFLGIYRDTLLDMSSRRLLFILLFITGASLVYAQQVDVYRFDNFAARDASRLLTIEDASNMLRIIALTNYIDFILERPLNFLIPVTAEEYAVLGEFRTAPHNTFLSIMFNLGLPLTIVYVIYIGQIFKDLKLSLRSFLAYLPYMAILGGVLYGPSVLLFPLSVIRRQK